MRHKGEENEYQEQRTKEIMAAYKTIMANYGGRVSVMTIYEMVAFSPASRFFITKGWAYRVVRNYHKYKGQPNRRQRMYKEIYDRVQELLKRQPELTLPQAVDIVIQQPAPEMYMKTVQIMRIVNKERARQGRERLLNIQEREKTMEICKNCRYWINSCGEFPFCAIKELYTLTKDRHQCDEYDVYGRKFFVNKCR